jgi:16S rRNA (uracil1498-N3)-methyltransferase
VRRLILENPPDARGRIRLEGSDFRYLARVLRKAPGDAFRVLLPGGLEAFAEVVSIDAQGLEATIGRRGQSVGEDQRAAASSDSGTADAVRRAFVPALPPFVLIQELPKAMKMDDIVRQATELGVSLIIPFISDHSVSRPEGTKAAGNKRERWLRIVKEARQQSGSDIVTDVLEPVKLPEALGAWDDFARARGGGTAIFLHQDPLAQGTMHGYLSRDPNSIALAVGPEGGFSETETKVFAAAGFHPAILGVNILRTETAAVSALAAAQVIILEKTSWMPRTPDSPALNV